jgi:hypothetical protein
MAFGASTCQPFGFGYFCLYRSRPITNNDGPLDGFVQHAGLTYVDDEPLRPLRTHGQQAQSDKATRFLCCPFAVTLFGWPTCPAGTRACSCMSCAKRT